MRKYGSVRGGGSNASRLLDRIYTDDMAQSEIDYADWIEGRATTTRVLKRPREHQSEAIRACLNKFRTYDRGKLIMACGTGKTITALRLTEALLHDQGKTGGRVLFLAPSIALVGQSMREWANQSQVPLECAVVCSDTKASNLDEDTWESSLRDLPYPASTDPEAVYAQMKEVAPNSLSVIFSTYQSIQVVSDAQRMGCLLSISSFAMRPTAPRAWWNRASKTKPVNLSRSMTTQSSTAKSVCT